MQKGILNGVKLRHCAGAGIVILFLLGIFGGGVTMIGWLDTRIEAKTRIVEDKWKFRWDSTDRRLQIIERKLDRLLDKIK